MSQHIHADTSIRQPLGCEDVEVLLADFLDQTLKVTDRLALERHMESCAACCQMAAEIADAMELMERSAAVEPPPELINKLLFEVTNGASRSVVRPSWPVRVASRLFGKWLEPVLQPRLAMGMAMTVLSLGMLLRIDRVRAMELSDLNPVEMYATAEDTVADWYDSAVKYYVSMRLVFEIEALYQDWMEQQAAVAEEQSGAAPPQNTPLQNAPGPIEPVPQGAK